MNYRQPSKDVKMDADYLPFHSNPSKPSFVPPKGAVDAHCHVFGPHEKFPYSVTRKYTPCDAPKEKLFELRDFLNFERNVIVQASCHGTDNSALVDALNSAGELARGVAVVKDDISSDELIELHKVGVRGVRFNFIKRLVDKAPQKPKLELAKRIHELGWHSVIYFDASELDEVEEFILQLPGIVLIDHMGRPDVSKNVTDQHFTRLLNLIASHENLWIKVSGPERLTLNGPPYNDVVPFGRALVERFEDRVLWGTDWPHPNMKSHVPDEGMLVDFIPMIATTDEKQKKLLVDNPMRLYWDQA